jgi:hypothetical protein
LDIHRGREENNVETKSLVITHHSTLRYLQRARGSDVSDDYQPSDGEREWLQSEMRWRLRREFAVPLSNRCVALFVRPSLNRHQVAMMEELARTSPMEVSIGPWGQYLYENPRDRGEIGEPCVFVIAYDGTDPVAVTTVIVPNADTQGHLEDLIAEENEQKEPCPPSGLRGENLTPLALTGTDE